MYIGGIGRNALIANNKPKEMYLPVRKAIFGRLNSEPVFKKGSEYSRSVLLVLFEGWAEDNDVIHVPVQVRISCAVQEHGQ